MHIGVDGISVIMKERPALFFAFNSEKEIKRKYKK
jgi:hypothetical protein